VTTPLVYVFAAAAVVLIVAFLLSAWLAYRHARERGRFAEELAAYIAESGVRFRDLDEKAAASLAERRERVMHITIGDLVRDAALTAGTAKGIAARRAVARPDEAPGSDPGPAEPSQ
jgi:hypothetical protein